MLKISYLVTVATMLMTLASSSTALARQPSAPTSKTLLPAVGNDVSYPQCGHTLPTRTSFGIVGVNGGVATNFNLCLENEISWAEKAPGILSMPNVALYANTGNPGDAISEVGDWPTTSSSLIDPYGLCNGTDSEACSWEYGYERAYADAARATASMWWLDIETVNSWSSDLENNRADLKGMIYAFTIAGSRIGVYSTPSWWTQILGSVTPVSELYRLPEWLPGASTNRQALSTCEEPPFTSGARIMLAQYTSNNLDYDVPCPSVH